MSFSEYLQMRTKKKEMERRGEMNTTDYWMWKKGRGKIIGEITIIECEVKDKLTRAGEVIQRDADEGNYASQIYGGHSL